MRTFTSLCGFATSVLLATASAIAQEPPAATPPVESTIAPQPAPSTVSQAAPAAMPTVPARGTSMDGVKSKFGAPSQEVPAVGQPPITRWEYPGYVVYFENDKVLHTVVAAR